MLGNRIIGLMESVEYQKNKFVYQQNYEIVGELQIKVGEEHNRFVTLRKDYLKNCERLEALQKEGVSEELTKFHWIMQAIEQFDLSYFEQIESMIPSYKGSIILYQTLMTVCQMGILNDMCEYYSMDEMLEKIEIGLKYLGRDEEVFMGLDLYYMLRETDKALQNMDQQVQDYLMRCHNQSQKVGQCLRELEFVVNSLPRRKHKKISFYKVGYEQREMIREVYQQIKVLEQMKKLPLYKGSLGSSHVFMDQLFAHLEQVQ